jgi:5-methylcytosine-specific restriction protein A
LCQGQGVTKVRNEFKKDTVSELSRRASLIRSRVPSYSAWFEDGPIELRGTSVLAKDYEPAVVWTKKYDLASLPGDEILGADLKKAIELYDLVLARGGTENIETAMSIIASDDISSIEEERKQVRHSKLERNRKTSKRVKAAQGYTCKGCKFNFYNAYGERGKEYIEAHHLTPLSSLQEGVVVSMNIHTDFAVLCSNCHSMVHRGKNLLTLEELIELPGVQRLRKINDRN